MGGVKQELARQGGRFNADAGQLLTAQDVDRIGEQAVQSLLHFLMLLFYDEARQEPMTGFPREQLSTDYCVVSSTGDLTFEISPGWGLLYNHSALGTDEWGIASYRPMVLDQVYEGTLAAHDATHPRIDIVCMAPAWVDDQPATRNVKDPSSGVISSSSINQRRRFGATIQVVTGTPAASPSAPSVPAGYVEIARASVPASSGAATWVDHRPVLELGPLLKGHVGRWYAGDFVPQGGANELLVSAQTPAAMAVDVARGRAVINGVSRLYQGQTLVVAAAPPVNPRIDLVVANEDGTLQVIAGTPAASPTSPVPSANQAGLAQISVAALATSIGASDITDVRIREPYPGSLIRKNSVNHDRLETPTARVELGTPVVAGNIASIPLTITYPDGSTAYDGAEGAGELELLAWAQRTSGIPGSSSNFGLSSGTTYNYGDFEGDDSAGDYAWSATGDASHAAGGSGTNYVVFERMFRFRIDDVSGAPVLRLHRKDGTVTGTLAVHVLGIGGTPISAGAPATVTFS